MSIEHGQPSSTERENAQDGNQMTSTKDTADNRSSKAPSSEASARTDGDVEKAAKSDGHQDEDSRYPSTKVVIPTMLSIYLAVFLAALDRTIIGVAIPAISDDFGSFSDIAWYEASYLLSFCALQLPIGRLYTMFPAKWIFLILVAIFEIGSLICAAAPTSNAFIVGRTVAGIGGAGIVSGGTILMVRLLPLRKRPKYQGLLGASFGLASIIGPLIGGAFTTKVTWRWCFWINLPIGGLALLVLFLVLPKSPPAEKLEGSFKQKVLKLDPLGSALLIPGLISLLFALQFGGSRYPWSDARVVAPLVLGPVLLLAFVGVEGWVIGENAITPARIIRQRSIAAGIATNMGLGAVLLVSTFYLPIWFQAIKGVPAVDAGIRLLPYFLSTVVFVIGSGVIVSKTGYYTPWLIVGTALGLAGSGLLTTLKPSTSTGEWIGYQLLLGAGVGMSLQQTINAAQTVLPEKDIPIGVTVLGFTQIFSGTLAVPVCQTVLSNTLNSQLASKLPGFDTKAIASSGATDIRNLVRPDQLPIVLKAYNTAIDNLFYVSLAFACVAFLSSMFVEWKTVRKPTSE